MFHEATSAAGKLGAQEILDWYRAHTDQVRVEPTDIFREEMLLYEMMAGRKPGRDLGERAALEIIRNYPLGDNARTLLLSDDRDAERMRVFEPEPTILLTTWDYLRQLEEARRIQSADAVMDAVRETGRHPPKVICGAITTLKYGMPCARSSMVLVATRGDRYWPPLAEGFPALPPP